MPHPAPSAPASLLHWGVQSPQQDTALRCPPLTPPGLTPVSGAARGAQPRCRGLVGQEPPRGCRGPPCCVHSLGALTPLGRLPDLLCCPNWAPACALQCRADRPRAKDLPSLSRSPSPHHTHAPPHVCAHMYTGECTDTLPRRHAIQGDPGSRASPLDQAHPRLGHELLPPRLPLSSLEPPHPCRLPACPGRQQDTDPAGLRLPQRPQPSMASGEGAAPQQGLSLIWS